ncbi:MAG: AAA family ATPase [Pseudomonadota bacterium]
MNKQHQMIAALLDSVAFGEVSGGVEHIQTHISHVILAGDFAYKIKKPLDLGFLDFSTLDRRKFCCEEELRLNRRMAPELYLDVIPITGSLDAPGLSGDGDAIEYAVRMRRFPQSGLLSEAPPDRETILQLAQLVSGFHQSIPEADSSTTYGGAERVIQPMLENFSQIREIGVESLDTQRLDALEAWTIEQAEQLRDLLGRRKQEGHIRECHGDMHLGNITRYLGKLEIFDGIEFNPNLSWIDTFNDAAFLLMDLEYRGLHQEAALFLNEYLAQSGDYDGLPLLRFYQLYRAMVRAKVAAILLAQAGRNEHDRQQIIQEFNGYLELAERYTHRTNPALFIAHGLSGSGKSLFSGWLAEALPAIHLRSDVERKRLFPDPGQTSGLGQGIYSADATQHTYNHLQELAKTVMQAGHSVIVDATFLKADQRLPFSQLAADLDKLFLILDCVAPDEVLRERILSRQEEGVDPSDADLKVLELQMENREPLNDQELAQRIEVDTTQFPPPGLLRQVSEHLSGNRS